MTLLGSSSRVGSACFHAKRTLVQLDRPPKQLCLDFKLHTKAPLQSSFASRPRAPFDGRWPTRGFGPHRDIHKTRLLTVEDPKPPLRSVLRLSQPLDGLLRVSCLQAYLILQPRPGLIACPGTSLLVQRLSPSGERGPLVVSSSSTRQPKLVATLERPRLRGFLPHEAALFVPQVLATTTTRSPHQVLVSSRLLCAPCSPIAWRHPLTTLPHRAFAFALALSGRPQRIASAQPGRSISESTHLPETFEPPV